MSWANISTVYLKELKDSLRDRRTLLSTIIIPTLVMPLLTFGFAKVAITLNAKARAEIPTIMVLGGDDSQEVKGRLAASPKFHVVPIRDDWKQEVADKKIRAVVEIPRGFGAGLKSGAAPTVIIYNYNGELRSSLAANELEGFFRELRQETATARLAEHGLPATLVRVFETRRENVAPPERVGGEALGGIIPYVIIILCFTGAMYPAIDLTAGEKERGTMETLLCSPVKRIDLVLGKFLMVLTGSVSAMLFSLISMAVSFYLLSSSLPMGGAPGPGRRVAAMMPTIDPLGIVGVLAMVIPISVLFAAVIFTIALFAKSYKEAQSYAAPLVFIVIFPAIGAIMPGVELNARLACVPILNVSLACKEMLSGVWHWNLLSLIFLSSALYAAGALALAVRMFSREDVIFRA